MADKRFDDLLTAYLESEISEEDLTELHKLVHASEPLRRRFQEETRVHVLLRETLAEEVEIQSSREMAIPPRHRPSGRWPYAVVAAAVLLIAALVGYTVYRPSSDAMPEIGICMNVSGSGELSILRGYQRSRATRNSPLQVGDRVTCDADTRAMLRLSDGSILSLESGAQLTLVTDRPEVRLLQGEAFFEIAPRNANTRSFQVRTGNSTVDVMGTVFSLAANRHTELKVYEGIVTLTRHSDKATVKVGSQQMATTGTKDLAVEELSRPSMEILSLLPTDDMTLDRGQRELDYHRLKVEGRRRVVYLRFVVPDVEGFRSARLRLTQDIDAGGGTLRFFVGDHSNWNEDSLTEDGAPKQLAKVAQRRGVVGRGQTVEVDVSDAVRHAGPITIIVTLDKTREDDIWFGSREGDHPPQLILAYGPKTPIDEL